MTPPITDEKLAELERRARSRLGDSLDGRPPNFPLPVDPDDVIALVAEVRRLREVPDFAEAAIYAAGSVRGQLETRARREEREACAKIAEGQGNAIHAVAESAVTAPARDILQAVAAEAWNIADAIRARGADEEAR